MECDFQDELSSIATAISVAGCSKEVKKISEDLNIIKSEIYVMNENLESIAHSLHDIAQYFIAKTRKDE